MAGLVKTVMVIDQTGKAVNTSKHVINIFKEAKSAYRERKAEVVAARHHDEEEKMMRRALKAQKHQDRSVASSRRSSRSGHPSKRPTTERHHTTPLSPRSPKFDADGNSSPRGELVRRHTDRESGFTPPATPRRALTTSAAAEEIDMDLAYGEIPPPLPVATVDEEAELKGLVNKVKMILETADCLQYTAATTMKNLQKDPEAMASVALALTEISNLLTKMAPGALLALKSSAPAVFALLASPQFLIGGGVAVGVTVIAFGGYKIVKKIKAKHSAKEDPDPGMDEMLQIGVDVNSIDTWRRGIAEAEAQSVGTSVEGEFITPHAAAVSRLTLDDNGMPPMSKDGEKRKKKKSKKESDSKSVSSKDSKSSDKSKKDKREKREKKEKKPSQLRLMFTSA
ncbi:MAG: hypothetical protein Q9195_000111 [Heterodermia aff. obscurata]